MNEARPAASKLRILDSAKRLTQSRGFAATTVDAVCEDAGLTKGSFFHHFRSKEDLGVAMLQHFWAALGERMAAAPYRAESEPLARIRKFLDYQVVIYQEPGLREGCLLAIFTQETPDADSPLRTVSAGYFADWVEDVTEELRRLMAACPPRASVSAEELARYFVSLLQGSLILAKASGKPAIVADNLRQFGDYLESLLAAPQMPAAPRRGARKPAPR